MRGVSGESAVVIERLGSSKSLVSSTGRANLGRSRERAVAGEFSPRSEGNSALGVEEPTEEGQLLGMIGITVQRDGGFYAFSVKWVSHFKNARAPFGE